jgi:excisionase family DNA binding protein
MANRLLISQGEAARMLGISRLTLIAEIDKARLRYVLVGSRRKFKPEDLQSYIERVRRGIAGIAAVRYDEEHGPPAPAMPDLVEIKARALFGRARSSARLRGKPFGLTEKAVAAMIARAGGHCEVSGLPFSYLRVGTTAPFAPSIDRIDAAKGYSPENCRLVCYAVNVALHEWGDAVLRRIARGIVERENA